MNPKKSFFASMLATMFFLFFASFTASAGTDPIKTKTDPGKSGMTVPIASLEELAQYVSENSSTVLILSNGSVVTTSIPILKERSDLKTEILVQKLNGTLELFQINTQTRNDGVVESQIMYIYPLDQNRNYIQGKNPTPANNPYNAVAELNSLFNAKKQSTQQQTTGATSDPKQTSSQPEQTARSASQPAQPKKLQK